MAFLVKVIYSNKSLGKIRSEKEELQVFVDGRAVTTLTVDALRRMAKGNPSNAVVVYSNS